MRNLRSKTEDVLERRMGRGGTGVSKEASREEPRLPRNYINVHINQREDGEVLVLKTTSEGKHSFLYYFHKEIVKEEVIF